MVNENRSPASARNEKERSPRCSSAGSETNGGGVRPENAWAAVTVITASYLPYARVLFESLRAQHPGVRCTAVLVDRVNERFDAQAEPFEVLPIEELDVPDLPRFLFQYVRFERVMACKPWALAAVLKRHPEIQRVLYFDADLLALQPLDFVLKLLEQASLVLTPHALKPLPGGRKLGEHVFLRTGVFNAGFLALRRCPSAEAFLAWWQKRLSERCLFDLPMGFFVDQKWLDLAPGLFEGVKILRDPGYNAAPWNILDRGLKRDPETGQWQAGGRPLVLFHFSDFDPARPADLSWLRSGGERPAELDAALRTLAELYAERLRTQGYEACRAWTNAFDLFANGRRIPPSWHLYYHDVLRHRMGSQRDPYEGLPLSPVLALLRLPFWNPRQLRENIFYREWVRFLRHLGWVPHPYKHAKEADG